MATSRRVKTREERRQRRHRRVRAKVQGTGERPRLVIHRSINHVEGQVVDDVAGRTLVGLSTLDAALREKRGEMNKTQASHAAGKALAEKARELGVTIRCLPFDQSGTEAPCVVCGRPAKLDAVYARAY